MVAKFEYDVAGNHKAKALRGWLLTGNGMLEIIEAMREREWDVRIINWNGGYTCHFSKYSQGPHADADLAPEAVARAASAALQEQGQ
jgi:hypothetical protein